jgi:branched-chain amino acid transport system permease protein
VGGAVLVTFSQILDPGSYQPINHTFLIWVALIVGGAGNNWGALFGAVLIYVVWLMSEPLAQFLLGAVNNGIGHFGWGTIPDIESRSLQMRVFVLGLVITLALRYAPRGLIPEVAQTTR